MRTVPAELVFREDEEGGRWYGRLLNPRQALDAERDLAPVAGTPRFDVEQCMGAAGPMYRATMQGGDKHSRRYRTYATLPEAQEAGRRWAARRFRIPFGPEET